MNNALFTYLTTGRISGTILSSCFLPRFFRPVPTQLFEKVGKNIISRSGVGKNFRFGLFNFSPPARPLDSSSSGNPGEETDMNGRN